MHTIPKAWILSYSWILFPLTMHAYLLCVMRKKWKVCIFIWPFPLFWKKKIICKTQLNILCYHPRRSVKRAFGSEGSRSPKANIPARTPVKIDATAAQVETTIALPCFRPRVCKRREDSDYLKSYCLWNRHCRTLLGQVSQQLTENGLISFHGMPKGCNGSRDSRSYKSALQNTW